MEDSVRLDIGQFVLLRKWPRAILTPVPRSLALRSDFRIFTRQGVLPGFDLVSFLALVFLILFLFVCRTAQNHMKGRDGYTVGAKLPFVFF